jgi:apolipoprotein N-acyltransferase
VRRYLELLGVIVVCGLFWLFVPLIGLFPTILIAVIIPYFFFEFRSNKQLALLALGTGVLLGISWPHTGGVTPLIFVALVPMLFLENHIHKKKYMPYKVLRLSYFMALVFNTITTWWIYHASPEGAFMAVLANSFIMAIVFWLFHLTRRRVGDKEGYVAFVIYWLGFEWAHFNWELSWPWLTFGNSFADFTKWVQWYEYTGVLGGTLWVLCANMVAFFLLKEIISNHQTVKSQWRRITTFGLIILIPIVASLSIYYGYEEKKDPVSVVAIQPNINPYKKFNGELTPAQQVRRIISLGQEKTDAETDFVIAPETALPYSLNESELDSTGEVKLLRRFMQPFPDLRMIIGMSSYKLFFQKKAPSLAARQLDEDVFQESYNTAMQLETGQELNLYHKSKLVLGVERLPFAWLLKPIEGFAIDLGGTTGTLGVEEEPFVFSSKKSKAGKVVAPVICYESIYGEYVTEYVKKGAELIFIITNDGWWKDTPGYKHHVAYARLRAIENRRSIARSANTGVSCFINQRGDVFKATKWWKPDVIKMDINANSTITFYTEHGDYIGRVAVFVAILMLLWTIVRPYKDLIKR